MEKYDPFLGKQEKKLNSSEPGAAYFAFNICILSRKVMIED